MTVATLPPSVHIAVVRSLLEKMLRTKAAPSRLEIQQALESLAKVRAATKNQPQPGSTS
jgi:hypothetical protein